MSNKNKKPVVLPNWPATPPMEPFAVTLAKHGPPVTRIEGGMRGDPKENFELFARQHGDLNKRAIGNAEDLAMAYTNAHAAEYAIRELDKELAARGVAVRDERASNAGANVIVACAMVQTASLAYMRENWHHHAVLVLCRSALEATARGGMIALGTVDESERWWHGPDLPTREERRAAELSASAGCRAIEGLVLKKHPGASRPLAVYEWLCGFTHLDSKAIRALVPHEASYATLAYAAWLAAVVAEAVCGHPFAAWPKQWPAKLPWT